MTTKHDSPAKADDETVAGKRPEEKGYQPQPGGTGATLVQKFSLLAALYISQGVSAGFVVVALPALLRFRGESVEVVGWAGLLSWPWALKFLWGPLVDRYGFPGFGVRRTWILPLQILVAAFLFTLAVAGDADELTPILVLIVLMNVATSILDVATDAYATDSLLPAERGWGNGIQIGGFYAGSLIGGGIFLVLNERLGTQPAFCLLGLAVLLPAWLLRTNREKRPDPPPMHPHPRLRAFFQRSNTKYILAAIVLLDFGENFGVSMLSSFFVDAGLSSENIGWLLGTGGMVAGLFGAVAGGALVKKLSQRRALLVFSGLQTIAMIGYVALANAGAVGFMSAGVVIAVQYFSANMFNVALYTCFMEWTSPTQAATDFSIMACAHNATFLVAAPLAGYSVAAFGYAQHFSFACLLSFAGIAIAARFVTRGRLLRSDDPSLTPLDATSVSSAPENS